jgi:hypothetical protein
MSVRRLLLLSAALCAVALPAAAEDLEALVRSSFVFAGGEHATVRFRMTIHGTQGEVEREVQVSIKRTGSGQSTLARIVAPASLSGMKYLRIDEGARGVRQWLKTSRGLRRIGEGSGEERLFGSDLTVGDLTGFDPAGSDLAEVPDREEKDARAISLTSRDRSRPDRIVILDREQPFVLAADTLSHGQVVRSYRVEQRGQTREAFYPARAIMRDLAAGTWTRLEVLSIDLESPLSDRLFNPAGL